jgi:hypothetical protein
MARERTQVRHHPERGRYDRAAVEAVLDSALVAHDFDFLVGTWQIANRRLTELFVDSDEWDEFPATSVVQRFFDGAGSFDTIRFPTKGWSGVTLRLFDPEREEWAIHWANSRTGVLRPPSVVGRFVDGRGEFYCDDTHDGTPEGRPVRVRYLWSDITDDSAHWEQAFSVDGGETWETNWIMDLARADS